ncbi:hypothetical protein V2J09_013733 [Rumex salicifolius]
MTTTESPPLSDADIVSLARRMQAADDRSAALPPYILSTDSHETLVSYLSSRASSDSPSSSVSEYAIALISLVSLSPQTPSVSSLLSSLLIVYIDLFKERKIPRDSNSRKTLQLFTLHLSSISPEDLVSISEAVVSDLAGVADADDAQLLDVLPPCLELILRSNEVDDRVDVVNSVFEHILASNWSKALLVKLVSIIREFPVVDKSRRSEFLKKVFDGMNFVDLQDIPSLSYQLLVAASKGFNKRVAMEGIVMFFGSKLGAKATTTARQVEGTVLLHVNFAVKQDPSLAQELLGLLKSDIRVLNHFTVAVLLSVSRVRKFNLSCMGVLKTAVLSVYRDHEMARTCKWLPEELRKEFSERAILVEKAFIRAVTISSFYEITVHESSHGREHIVPSFVHFGFLLLENIDESIPKKSNDTDNLMGIEGLSIQMLKMLFDVHEMSRTEIIEHCKFRILSLKPRECKPVARLLGLLVLSYPYPMLEHIPRLKEILDYFAYIHSEIATCLIGAVIPLTKYSPDLQDYIILVVRKAMFNREETVRAAATSAVLDLILAVKSKYNGPFSLQESSSQASSSQQGELLNGKQGGLLLELSSLLQRCLYQQAKVKEILYAGLLKLVLVEPSTAGLVLDLLLPHFLRYYHEEDELQLNLNSCVKSVSDKICLDEPLDCLFSCVCWILILQPQGKHNDTSWTCFGFSLSQENEGGKTLSGDSFASFLQKLRKLMRSDKMGVILSEIRDKSSGSAAEEKGWCIHILSGMVEVIINYVASELEKSAVTKRADLEREIIELVDLYESLQKDICTSKHANNIKRGNSRISAPDIGSSHAKQAQECRSFLGASSICQLLLTALELLKDTCSTTAAPQNKSHNSPSKVSISSTRLICFVLNASHKHIKSVPLIGENDIMKTLVYGDTMKLGPLILKLVCALISGLKSEANKGKAKKEAEDRKECIYSSLTCLRDLISITMQSPDKASLIKDLSVSLVECDYDWIKADSDSEPEFETDDQLVKANFLFLQKVTRPLLSELLRTSSFREVQALCDIVMTVGSKLPREHRTYLGNWIVSVCKSISVTDSKAAQSLVKLALALKAPPDDLEFALEIAAEMYNVASEESSLSEMSGEYHILNSSTWTAIASSILQSIESVTSDLQWAGAKLKGYTVVTKSITLLDEYRDKIPRSALEQAVYSRAESVVKVLNPFMSILLNDSQAEQILRFAAKLYKQLALMSKLWIASKSCKQLVPTPNFQKLVEITCKELTSPLYSFIEHVQQSQIENDKKKGIINKIKRENRCIPDLIFQIEDYERYLIQLSKATRLNLLRHAKRSTCRDFRIVEPKNAAETKAADPENPRNHNEETEEPVQDDHSDKSGREVEDDNESEKSCADSIDQTELAADSGCDSDSGTIARSAKRMKLSRRVLVASDDEGT